MIRKKKKQYEYVCSRCSASFYLDIDWLSPKSAVCPKCFDIIKNSKTADEYYRNIRPVKDVFHQFAGKTDCPRCHGVGSYMYDEIHGKICERCCTHPKGFMILNPEYYGEEARRYKFCKIGCGAKQDIKTKKIYFDGGIEPVENKKS